MFEIEIYRDKYGWSFDDSSRGIKSEPFVLGASELITKYLKRKGMGKRKKGIKVEFSTTPLPEFDFVLSVTEKCYPWKLKDTKQVFGTSYKNHKKNKWNKGKFQWIEDTIKPYTSAWYVDQEGHKCWLCPCQLKFFGQVADEIYAKIK